MRSASPGWMAVWVPAAATSCRRLGVGLDGGCDALLLGQVGDLVAGAAGVEQVGGELGVAGGKQAGDVLAVGDHAVAGERVDQRGRVVGRHDQHVA